MKKIIVLGTNCYSCATYQMIIREEQAQVIAFSASKGFISEQECERLPVIPLEDLPSFFNMEEVEVLIPIGYSKMNDLRKFYYDECKKLGYKIFTFVSKNALVYSDDIGEGSLILPGSYVGPYAKVGICCHITNGVHVSHHNIIGDFCFISAGTMFGGNVTVGNNCFIGMESVIKNGITIGDRVFIAANSYAKDNMQENKGYLGNPATNPKGISSDVMIRFV